MLADKEDEDNILCYVSYLLKEFRLTQWTVMVSGLPTEPEEEGDAAPHASIHTHDDRYCAVLQVHKDWSNYPTAHKTETLVHEMLHLVTRDLRSRMRFWCIVVAGKMGDLTGHMGIDADSAEERLVDHLATVIAPYLAQYPGPLSAPIPTVRREGAGD